jgi:hypothetical protein
LARARAQHLPGANAYLALLYELPAGLYLALDGEAHLYVLRLHEGPHGSLRAAFAPRGTPSLANLTLSARLPKMRAMGNCAFDAQS